MPLRRTSFRTMDRFCVFYGAGQLEKLMQYDTVVLEPGLRTPEEVRRLQGSGTIVLAYVSVMEIHSEHPLITFVDEADLLRDERPPHDYIMQLEYGNRIVDLQSSSWRGHLLRHIGELVTRQGYDGVFLDTIGDVEMAQLPNALQQVEGAVAFVQQVRQWFPDIVLIQNNGLEILCEYTAPFLDAIMWENPPIARPESKGWVNAVVNRLVEIRLVHPVRIIVVFEGTRQDSRSDFLRGLAFAQEHGFTPYFSPQHYQSFHR